MKGRTKLIERLEEEIKAYKISQEQREHWFSKFIEEERRKHGHYEENEFGPVCP